MKTKNLIITLMLLLVPFTFTLSQRKYNPPPMNFNIGAFQMNMNKLMGDGGLQSQFSWNLASGTGGSALFNWPQDEYYSNMLYQIFNPVSLDDKGIKDENGVVRPMYRAGDALTNPGTTDWAIETRRYRPPHVSVDGVALDAPYLWNVDPKLKSDIKIEFEDVCGQFGIRSHVEMMGFSNQDHQNYFIWKATHKFTGEVKVPRQAMNSKDTIPDQTIRFWWPIAFSFGPTRNGNRNVVGSWGYEGEDDLDNWMKVKSQLNKNGGRDSLYIAYYQDYTTTNVAAYTNGSVDDMGDPDKVNGHLYSSQIPGYTLLYADKAYNNKVDDATQPYAMPHAGIGKDLWGRRDLALKLTYRGDDSNGKFPVITTTEKGPMRFITVGPYELTKDSKIGRYDSVTFVYAVGAGGIGWKMADSVGKMWMQKKISDQEKDAYILQGKDSLAKNLDRANWAWNRLSKGQWVPAAPPAPDLSVTSGPDLIKVQWSYPDPSYYKDAETDVDDWYAWRVYRKIGGIYVNDPADQKNGSKWELVYETTNRAQTTYVDTNVTRGVDYYYAVTAVDNGTQNSYDITPNQKLESSRFINKTFVPATSYKAGLSESGKVRVVPNPATSAAGTLSAGMQDGNKISFYNLPYKCKLRIYTETGGLVTSIDHLGTADEDWFQRTDQNQFVASGIYILAVTDSQDVNGNPLDNQFVKFIIVR